MLSDKEWDWIERAIILARDTAFMHTGSKDHMSVKRWETLRDRVKEVRLERCEDPDEYGDLQDCQAGLTGGNA